MKFCRIFLISRKTQTANGIKHKLLKYINNNCANLLGRHCEKCNNFWPQQQQQHQINETINKTNFKTKWRPKQIYPSCFPNVVIVNKRNEPTEIKLANFAACCKLAACWFDTPTTHHPNHTAGAAVSCREVDNKIFMRTTDNNNKRSSNNNWE